MIAFPVFFALIFPLLLTDITLGEELFHLISDFFAVWGSPFTLNCFVFPFTITLELAPDILTAFSFILNENFSPHMLILYVCVSVLIEPS